MGVTDRLTLDDSKNGTQAVLCATCHTNTEHTVLASANFSGGDDEMSWWNYHQFIMCKGCRSISLRSVSGDSESFDHATGEHAHHEEIYPPRVRNWRGLMEDHWRLPIKVRAIYSETCQALASGFPVLAGTGIRAIVETVCKDRSAANGKNLYAQIEALVEQRVITPKGAAVLHQLRHLGNAAAHEVEPHKPEQLALAVSVIEHLLREVYLLHDKAASVFPAFKPDNET